jgi:hypothetical protein
VVISMVVGGGRVDIAAGKPQRHPTQKDPVAAVAAPLVLVCRVLIGGKGIVYIYVYGIKV